MNALRPSGELRKKFGLVCELRARQKHPRPYVVEPMLPEGTPAGRLVLPNRWIAGTQSTSREEPGSTLSPAREKPVSPTVIAVGTCAELANWADLLLPWMVAEQMGQGVRALPRWIRNELLTDILRPFFTKYPTTLGAMWLPQPLIMKWNGNPGLPRFVPHRQTDVHTARTACPFGHDDSQLPAGRDFLLSRRFVRNVPFASKDAESKPSPLLVTDRKRIIQSEGRFEIVPEFAISRSMAGADDTWRAFDSLDEGTIALDNGWAARGFPVLSLFRFLDGGSRVQYLQNWFDSPMEKLHRIVATRMTAETFWPVIYSLEDSLQKAALVQSVSSN